MKLRSLATRLAVCTGLLVPWMLGCTQSTEAPSTATAESPVEEVTVEEEEAELPMETADEPAEPAEEPTEDASAAKEEAAEPKPTTVTLGDPELTAGIPGEGPVTVEELTAWLDDPSNHEELEVILPVGLDKGQGQIKGLDENPMTRAKIELGRQLFFDPRLSSDASISCASCHHPDSGYTRHTQFGIGVQGQTGGRNSPISYNRILSDKQFWDGRAASLEEQALGPIANPIEMASTLDACIECLKGIEGYQVQFDKVFGELTEENVSRAIAAFERAIVTGPSPYDYQEKLQAYEGIDLELLEEDDPEAYADYEETLALSEANPMSESAKRGMKIFFSEKGNCSACHVGPNLTDEQYYNLGVGMDAEEPDQGRFEVTKEDAHRGAFKTPTIRNVALTSPYMHDGSQETLMEVVEWYAKGGHENPHLHERVKKLDLTDQDKQDLVAFMEACTGSFPLVNQERLPK